MNDTLKRRLIGLLVLLVLVFALSLLLPDNWPESGEKGVPSTTLPLTANGLDATASAPTSEPAVSEGANATAPPPAASITAAPARTGAMPESVSAVDSSAPPLSGAPAATPKPMAATPLPPPGAVKPPVPKLAESVKPEVKAEPKAAAKPEPKVESKPPALKLTQSLPPMNKPAAAPAPPAKPATPPPPVPAAPKLAAVPTPPAPIVSSAPAQAKLWYVQIGSFADQGNAQTTLNLLQNIGARGESKQITSASGSALYRVRLGPFPSEAVAQQAFDKVSHQGYPQARVVSEAGVAKH
ncbi:MAG: hypothetical protein JWR07_4003 [Nevskia sp.]|nr:hypothetical protein [Nevskia sp.]